MSLWSKFTAGSCHNSLRNVVLVLTTRRQDRFQIRLDDVVLEEKYIFSCRDREGVHSLSFSSQPNLAAVLCQKPTLVEMILLFKSNSSNQRKTWVLRNRPLQIGKRNPQKSVELEHGPVARDGLTPQPSHS